MFHWLPEQVNQQDTGAVGAASAGLVFRDVLPNGFFRDAELAVLRARVCLRRCSRKAVIDDTVATFKVTNYGLGADSENLCGF